MVTALRELGLTEDQARKMRAAVRRALDTMGVRLHWSLLEAKKEPGFTEDELEQADRRVKEWLKELGITIQEPDEQEQQESHRGKTALLEQFLTVDERARLYRQVVAETAAKMEAAAEQLIAGEISPNEFKREMEYQIRNNVLASYKAGKAAMGGGLELSREEERDVLRIINRQINYLHRFVKAIKSDQPPTEAQIRYRAGQYAKGATAGPFENGRANAFGRLNLPQVPRDGKTRCKMNCKCQLRFEPEYDADGNLVAVKVYWELRPAEHCDDCKALAKKWNPLRVEV